MTMKVTLFICLVITFIFFCSSKTTTTGTIKWWCTQTPYYQTCNHYVAKRNNSTAIVSINQFLDLTVHAAKEEARVVLKRAQGIEATYPNPPEKTLWHSCVFYFEDAVFNLNTVLDHTHKPSPDDIQTWISASVTDVDMCEDGFEMMNITTTMLTALTTNLTQLLLNSLAISVAIKGGNPPGLNEMEV